MKTFHDRILFFETSQRQELSFIAFHSFLKVFRFIFEQTHTTDIWHSKFRIQTQANGDELSTRCDSHVSAASQAVQSVRTACEFRTWLTNIRLVLKFILTNFYHLSLSFRRSTSAELTSGPERPRLAPPTRSRRPPVVSHDSYRNVQFVFRLRQLHILRVRAPERENRRLP